MDSYLTVQVTPKTPAQLVELLLFLNATGMSFNFDQTPLMRVWLLNEIGQNPALTPEVIHNARLTDITNDLPPLEPFITFQEELRQIQTRPPATELRTPSKAFKAFCGSEYMTPKGEITREQARECIMLYIQRRSLLSPNRIEISLTEELRDALGETRGVIWIYELESVIERIFLPK